METKLFKVSVQAKDQVEKLIIKCEKFFKEGEFFVFTVGEEMVACLKGVIGVVEKESQVGEVEVVKL